METWYERQLESEYRFRESMFAAAARYRNAMRGSIKPHDGIRAALKLAARNALYEEGIGCLRFNDLVDAVTELGTFNHRYDRMEYQVVIIARFFNTVWFSTRVQ